MKKLVLFSLYLSTLLLTYITLPKIELVSQQRQVGMILDKFNKYKSTATEETHKDSLFACKKNEINVNSDVDANDSIIIDAKINVDDNVKDDATFDTNIVDIYKTIGVLEIPKLDIKYPILDETTEGALELSVTAYSGKINEIGNFVIAGHNYKNGFAFGRLKLVQKGDIVKVEGVKYRVFDIFVVDDTAVAKVIDNDTHGERWVTLFTCTNNGKDRLVVRAKSI